MKTLMYVILAVAAILTGLVIYGQHVDAVNREQSRQAWERAEQASAQDLAEATAKSICLKIRIQYARQGVSLSDQKLLLEEKGYNLDCTEGGK